MYNNYDNNLFSQYSLEINDTPFVLGMLRFFLFQGCSIFAAPSNIMCVIYFNFCVYKYYRVDWLYVVNDKKKKITQSGVSGILKSSTELISGGRKYVARFWKIKLSSRKVFSACVKIYFTKLKR